MNQINIQYYKTKIGELILGSLDGKLCLLDFRQRKTRVKIEKRIKDILSAEFIEKSDDILEKTKRQIDEYLAGKRKEFDIKILITGTDFQKIVWRALVKVKYGKTASYLDLARKAGREKSARAVANAIGANPIALIIPCHRIIGSDGALVGYSGGLSTKRRLLKLEKETLV